MAKPRKAKRQMPAVGAAFAVPLSNGMWGGCRVIRVGYSDGSGPPDPRALRVAAVDWVGPAPPAGTEPGFARLLRLTHHAHRNQGAAVWVGDRYPVPATFMPIASHATSPDDCSAMENAFGHWNFIPIQIEMQWRWDHERDAVLREDAAQHARKATANADARAAFQRKLDASTLATLRAEKPFGAWRRLWPAAAVIRAREIFGETIDQLTALGPDPKLVDATPILRACVEQFSALDGTGGFVIETEEREDICEHFARMVHAAGLAKYGSGDLTEQWREW